MLVTMMIYTYYALIPISMIATVIFDRKYEKYKRENGYKNNYRGTYKTKGLFDGHKFRTIADFVGKSLTPGYQFESLIELALFKGEAKTTLHKEEDSKAIEWVDPAIIDAEFKIVSEEKADKKVELPMGENEELVMQVVSQMENPEFDEETQEYVDAVESYRELYEHYTEEINKQNAANIDLVDEKREPRLK